MANQITYQDRFGHEWIVRGRRASGGSWTFSFVCGDTRLVAEDAVSNSPASLSANELKDLFCDAERVLPCDGETWYVGYRAPASGSRGRVASGLCTRFRSDGGEIRYSRTMIDFRHMPTKLLRQHLAQAGGLRASAAKR